MMKKTEIQLDVEYVSLNSIVPYEHNPKIHEKKQISQIAKSIQKFGFNSPILVDEKSEIIAGHGRWFAAKELVLEEIPIIRLLHLTVVQKRAYRIADNKLTERGEWDTDLLHLEFSELEELDLDFSLDITGFDTTEIDIMLDDSITEKDMALDEKVNAVPFIPEEEIISKVGDLWLLDKHRLLCGNALKAEDYQLLLDGKKAAMVFTDPPYNVKVNGHVCGGGRIQHKEFAMASGEMSSEEFQEFLSSNFQLLREFSADGTLLYVCMDWRHIRETICAGTDIFDDFKNLCVWNKTNGGMGSLYRSQHELIFIFKNGTAPHVNNVELGKHGRYRTNVWGGYQGINTFGSERDNLKLHPTVKPVELVKDAILDVTNRGDIVLDTFLGSGTTLIAAEQSGRICYAIEIEPLYVDTAIRRYQEITGKAAVHQASGKTYDELLSEKLETKGGQDG